MSVKTEEKESFVLPEVEKAKIVVEYHESMADFKEILEYMEMKLGKDSSAYKKCIKMYELFTSFTNEEIGEVAQVMEDPDLPGND